jgi:hypothetical protein
MVSNCTLATYNKVVEDRYIDILRDILLAKKENINIYLKRDCSDSETKNTCFNVRVTTDLRISEYVFEQMDVLQEEMSYRMYKDAPSGFPEGMYFVMVINPLLRTPTSKAAVIVVVLLVLLIIISTFLFVHNMKNNKNKPVRGGNRKATLENIQEKMERNKKEKKGLLGRDDE